MKTGKLFVVPTPIGNLEDITLRSLRVLKECDETLAEDTRQTKKLFDHFQISKPLQSYHKFNERATVDRVIQRLQNGAQIALVSDGGTPGISDPGHVLIQSCIQHSIQIETLPGATAFVPALINSGFNTDEFVFVGFLPHKKGRQTMLRQLSGEKRTILLYESPFRVVKLMNELQEHFEPSRRVSASRELSKIFEETIRGTAAELLQHFQQKEPRGEFVIVIEGTTKK